MGAWPNADHIPALRESESAGRLCGALSDDSVKETEEDKKILGGTVCYHCINTNESRDNFTLNA